MIAMTIDGVLRDTNSGGVIPTGALLYRALTAAANVSLIASEHSEAQINHWLTVNNFTEHTHLATTRKTDPAEPGAARVRQILRLKERGSVDGLFECDPAVAEAVFTHGTPVYLFVAPAYSEPEFLPGFKGLPTPWSDLISEVERQRNIKAEDARLTQEMV